MPLYKEQGVVLRSIKLGEADKIVTIMTQGAGKIRAVAKGIRKTTSRFGARLEPFTHVSLLVHRGRGSLDTVTQAGRREEFIPLASAEMTPLRKNCPVGSVYQSPVGAKMTHFTNPPDRQENR